jgi:hypothetical protein
MVFRSLILVPAQWNAAQLASIRLKVGFRLEPLGPTAAITVETSTISLLQQVQHLQHMPEATAT